jgi:hypothetical protein
MALSSRHLRDVSDDLSSVFSIFSLTARNLFHAAAAQAPTAAARSKKRQLIPTPQSYAPWLAFLLTAFHLEDEWSVRGANAIISLRCLTLSRRFED